VSRAFRRTKGGVSVRLSGRERGILAALPELVAAVDPGEPAASRLDYRAHPDDPDAEAAYRDLTFGMLEEARRRDRAEFEASLGSDVLTASEADAWLRVIGEARLVLAARLGIDHDGWEHRGGGAEPVEMSLLRLLGAWQDDLVDAVID